MNYSAQSPIPLRFIKMPIANAQKRNSLMAEIFLDHKDFAVIKIKETEEIFRRYISKVVQNVSPLLLLVYFPWNQILYFTGSSKPHRQAPLLSHA